MEEGTQNVQNHYPKTYPMDISIGSISPICSAVTIESSTNFNASSSLQVAAFRDSPLIGTFWAEVSGLMSLGTLHKSSQVRNWPRIKDNHSHTPIWSMDQDFFWEPEGGVRVGETLGACSLILIQPTNLLMAFLAFLWDFGLTVTLHFSRSSFWCSNIGASQWVTCWLTAWRSGWDWNRGNWDDPFEPRNGRNEAI
jgi:hypothetical protein